MKQNHLWLKIAGFLLLVLIGAVACSGETAVDVAAGAGASVSDDGKINLNNMSRDQLTETIPDFSSRMVREFFEYQPYISIQEFRREIGKYVDDAQVADYEQYVFVPVAVDESDAQTLMQIPGVDAAVAEQLLAERPFGSNDAFLEALGSFLTAEQVAVASSYLQE